MSAHFELIATSDAEFAGRTGAFALRLHGLLEALLIHRQFALTSDVRRQVDREAVSIVKLENDVTGQLLAIEVGNRSLENFHALIERLCKARLFFCEYFLHVSLCFDELRIGRAHFLHERRDEFVEEQVVCAEFLAVPNRATNDPAQDIAPALIAGQDAVDDQE